MSTGNRSNNFVVGLTNDILTAHSPALWNYTLCGQYPGAVSDGATVSVHCTNTYERRLGFRFVIVQFPTSEEPLNVCEIEVFAFGIVALCYYLCDARYFNLVIKFKDDRKSTQPVIVKQWLHLK